MPLGHRTERCQEFLYVYLLSRSITTVPTCLRRKMQAYAKRIPLLCSLSIYIFQGELMESQKDIAAMMLLHYTNSQSL